MKYQRFVNDSVHWFMSQLSSRVVAESGVPSDRYHLGKLILQSLKDAPDFIMQIDGSTGESETNASVLERSIRCAISYRNFGLQQGDVIAIMGPNHLDLAIPLYAALYSGVVVAAVDKTFTVKELEKSFNLSKPKVIFCQSDRAEDIQLALNELDLEAQIVTFDGGNHLGFADFLEKFGDDTPVDDYKASDFDPEDTVSFLLTTSGTTGLPKVAATTHKNYAITGPYWWSRYTTFPSPTRIALIAASLQWVTAICQFTFSPIFRYTRLQTSSLLTQEHAYDLINTYKPTYAALSPTFMITLIKRRHQNKCDFTCFEQVLLGGSTVPAGLLTELKAPVIFPKRFQEISPNTEFYNTYGISEMTGIAFHPQQTPPGSSGIPMGCFQYRLVDIDTKEDVTEPNVEGELWVKGPGIFKEYYNDPKATEETFGEDRWFKTGDIFYRDENWNFFFVERCKLLLKYKGHQISPVEVENVIRQHSGVSDVAVTGIPDPECGDLIVAFVVKKLSHEVTADEIKDLVKVSLSDSKQLRGGVVFVDHIPMTATTKVHRQKLREIALEANRE